MKRQRSRFLPLVVASIVALMMLAGNILSSRWSMIGLLVLIALGGSELLAKVMNAGRNPIEIESESDAERLREVARKRFELENLPLVVRWGLRAGCLILAMAGAFTTVSMYALYGIAIVASALVSAALFMRQRNSGDVRVAVLEPRNIPSVLPLPWFGLALIQAALPLALLRIPGAAAPVALSISAALLCMALAWRTAKSPAILRGDDVPMEVLLDKRVRAHRAGTMLMFGFAMPLAFIGVIRGSRANEDLVIGVWSGLLFLALPFMLWLAFQRFRRINLGQH